MIITRTPLRISLAGGGSDMPAYYEKEPGCVVSFAINKYIYLSVNPKFDGHTRVSYAITENVERVEDLRHDLVREILREYERAGLEIASVSDIPGEGTGLGSSSTLAVGLIKALSYGSGTPRNLAETAYRVERERCGHPVGKQDHYAAAFGGLRRYEFMPNEYVAERESDLTSGEIAELEDALLLFYTGLTRSANGILQAQEQNFARDLTGPRLMADLARELWLQLQAGRVESLGEYLHRGWCLKKQFAESISNTDIDQMYARALHLGAKGGKLLGAGGGGFLLLAVPDDAQANVIQNLGLRRVTFKIDHAGSTILYRS